MESFDPVIQHLVYGGKDETEKGLVFSPTYSDRRSVCNHLD